MNLYSYMHVSCMYTYTMRTVRREDVGHWLSTVQADRAI